MKFIVVWSVLSILKNLHWLGQNNVRWEGIVLIQFLFPIARHSLPKGYNKNFNRCVKWLNITRSLLLAKRQYSPWLSLWLCCLLQNHLCTVQLLWFSSFRFRLFLKCMIQHTFVWISVMLYYKLIENFLYASCIFE